MDSLTWQEIVLAVVGIFEIIVRLTPSEKDNTILAKIIWVLNRLIPNRTKTGGTH